MSIEKSYPKNPRFSTAKIGEVKEGNYTEIEDDGTIISYGEATCWDDLSQAIIAARLDIASGRLNYDYFNGGVTFNSNARYPEEPVVIPIQARHKMLYGAGAVLRPHIHWMQEQAAVPNFMLGYKLSNYGDTTTKEVDWSNYTFSVLQSHAFTYSASVLLQISAFTEIDISSLNISGSIDFVLFRDTGNVSTLFAGADPVATDVTVKYSDSHAKFNMFGSREEYVK
jgi:hypothetical protein